MSKAAPAPIAHQPYPARVIFARIGWMTWYNGPQIGDERPKGGGRYNKENVGHELFNFANFNGRLYGFVRAQRRWRGLKQGESRLRLDRIDPTAHHAQKLDNVLVIFIARQRIVGWYRDAVAYWQLQPLPPDVTRKIKRRIASAEMKNFHLEDCVFVAPFDKAFLLHPDDRAFPIPVGKKRGFGQSNVRYPYKSGKRDAPSWMDKAVAFVLSYEKDNLLTNPLSLASSDRAAAIADEQSAGFQSNVEIRRAVENYAMNEAQKELQKRGYHGFKNTSDTKPYDYTCSKNGTVFYVEVKGTQTAGKNIFLTKNEVKHVKANRDACILVLTHSIKLSRKQSFSASGGTSIIREQWQLLPHHLTPIQFVWTVE